MNMDQFRTKYHQHISYLSATLRAPLQQAFYTGLQISYMDIMVK